MSQCWRFRILALPAILRLNAGQYAWVWVLFEHWDRLSAKQQAHACRLLNEGGLTHAIQITKGLDNPGWLWLPNGASSDPPFISPADQPAPSPIGYPTSISLPETTLPPPLAPFAAIEASIVQEKPHEARACRGGPDPS